MNQDMHNSITQKVALNGQTINTATTTNGNIIDTQYYNSLEFILGIDAYTSGVATPVIQEGDDPALADAANVDTNYLLGDYATVAGALNAANTTARIGYVGTKRYVRLSIVSTSTPNFYIKSNAILGHAHTQPTPYP